MIHLFSSLAIRVSDITSPITPILPLPPIEPLERSFP